MARFKCVCGQQIVTSGEVPNKQQWLLVSDREFDNYSGPTEADAIYMAATIMFRCPNCDHLWIYWDGFDNFPTLYGPLPTPGDLS